MRLRLPLVVIPLPAFAFGLLVALGQL